jgi:hypothetical protein
MRYLTAFFLALLLIPSLGAADVLYKWVDAQGIVHYSDKPAPGATKIDVPKAPTFTPPQVAAPEGLHREGVHRGDASPQSPAATGYTAITINSPQDQQTLWNVPSVTVSVNVAPALRPGDNVTISLDGAAQTVNGTSATFNDVDRGQHTVTASVGGINASPVTFYIQKTAKPP